MLVGKRFVEFKMILMPHAIAGIGRAKFHQSGNGNARSALAAGPQVGAAGGGLEVQFIDRGGIQDIGPAGDQRIVAQKGGATRAGIIPLREVEGVVDGAGIGERIAQHQAVLLADHLVKPRSKLRLLIGGREKS